MAKRNELLTIEEVKHTATLAKLKLDPEELAKFKDQLSQVLGYINKLQELKMKDILPTSQVTDLSNVFRKDEIRPSLTQTETLSNAKEAYQGFFKVEAIFTE